MQVPKPKPRQKTPKPLKRTPIARVNAKRKKKRFAENFGGKDYLAYVHSLPCDICGTRGHTVAAHLTSRGAGGKADVIAPLCCTRVLTTYTNDYLGAETGCHELYDAHHPIIRAHEDRLRKLAAERYKAFHELINQLKEK